MCVCYCWNPCNVLLLGRHLRQKSLPSLLRNKDKWFFAFYLNKFLWFAALCNKDSKVYGMLNTMGLVTPPHRKTRDFSSYSFLFIDFNWLMFRELLYLGCVIPVADDPNKVVIPKKRTPDIVVERLSYIMEDKIPRNGSQSSPVFGGHQTWKQREESFKIKPAMKVMSTY